jgi:heme exporter protein A
MLAGFLLPAGGEILWEEVPIARDMATYRGRLHYVGHADAVKPALTVGENLSFAAALADGGPVRIGEALDGFGLGRLTDAPGRLLSAGQRRRLALARLLAVDRPLWLLDEPAVGLDAANRVRLQDALTHHRAGHGIAVIATHGDIDVPDALVLDLGP